MQTYVLNNANKSSVIGVLNEKDQLVKTDRSRWIMLNIGKYIVFIPNLA